MGDDVKPELNEANPPEEPEKDLDENSTDEVEEEDSEE